MVYIPVEKFQLTLPYLVQAIFYAMDIKWTAKKIIPTVTKIKTHDLN